MKIKALGHYVIAISMTAACITAQAGTAKSNNWEYKTVTVDSISNNVTDKALNKWGKRGWELVACPVLRSTYHCIFKRPQQ